MRLRTVALLLLLAAAPMQVATRTWTGTIDSSWMNPGNWAGGVAPVADDDLLFPAGAVRLTATNDFPPLTRFHSITTSASGYDLGGNAVALGSGGLSMVHPTTISFPITLTGSQTWSGLGSIDGSVDLNGFALTLDTPGTLTPLAIHGTIGGTGAIVKSGTGQALFTADNTYHGLTNVLAGELRVTRAHGLGFSDADPNNGTTVQLGGALALEGIGNYVERITLFGSDDPFPFIPQLRAIGTVVVLSEPLVLAHGQAPIEATGTLRFEGPITGPGTLRLNGGATFTLANSHNDFTGGIRSTSPFPSVLEVAVNDALPHTGFIQFSEVTLRLNGFAATAGSLNTSRQIDLGSGGTLTLLDGGSFGDPVVGSGNIILKSGALSTDDANTWTGTMRNEGGTFLVSQNGKLPEDYIQTAGVLVPRGILGNVTVTGGDVRSESLTDPVATMHDLILGPDALYDHVVFPVPHGRVHVSGRLDLGGARLLLRSTFATPGTKSIVISNDGTGPVIGTFDRLPEGAIVAGNVGGLFQISYKGGDGNDVEVTALPPLAPIPMLDWWMLIALAAVIAVIGIQARLMR